MARVSRVFASVRAALAAAMMLAVTAAAGTQTVTPVDLLQAVRLNDAASVCNFLDGGADPDSVDRYGRPAVQVAVRYGHFDIARLLLDANADVNARDGDGWTALHHAAQDGDARMLRLLIARGADTGAADPYRYHALHLAARDGHETACEILIKAGADATARIDVGYTPADLAERFPDLQAYLRDSSNR